MIFLQKRNSINIRIADNMNPVIGLPLLLPSHITLKIATENNIVAKARISFIMKLFHLDFPFAIHTIRELIIAHQLP